MLSEDFTSDERHSTVPEYYWKEGILLKKARGRSFFRPWALRSFTLNLDQTLEYAEGSESSSRSSEGGRKRTVKGTLTVTGATITKLAAAEADGKEHAFMIEAPSEQRPLICAGTCICVYILCVYALACVWLCVCTLYVLYLLIDVYCSCLTFHFTQTVSS